MKSFCEFVSPLGTEEPEEALSVFNSSLVDNLSSSFVWRLGTKVSYVSTLLRVAIQQEEFLCKFSSGLSDMKCKLGKSLLSVRILRVNDRRCTIRPKPAEACCQMIATSTGKVRPGKGLQERQSRRGQQHLCCTRGGLMFQGPVLPVGSSSGQRRVQFCGSIYSSSTAHA